MVQFAVSDIFDDEGSSPSQIIAVWSPFSARWRSKQLALKFNVPSSNQRISMCLGSKEVFLTRVYGLIQSTIFLFRPKILQGLESSVGTHRYTVVRLSGHFCNFSRNGMFSYLSHIIISLQMLILCQKWLTKARFLNLFFFCAEDHVLIVMRFAGLSFDAKCQIDI